MRGIERSGARVCWGMFLCECAGLQVQAWGMLGWPEQVAGRVMSAVRPEMSQRVYCDSPSMCLCSLNTLTTGAPLPSTSPASIFSSHLSNLPVSCPTCARPRPSPAPRPATNHHHQCYCCRVRWMTSLLLQTR